MKRIFKSLMVLVVLGAILVFFLGMFLNTFVEKGVEVFGPQITGTSMTLQSVDLSPWSGVGHLEQLVVGNPQGFETPYAFKLGMVHVEADLPSVVSDTLIIREIVIDGPEINFEGTLAGSNISKIQENVDAFLKSEDTIEADPRIESEEGKEKKLVIDEFILKNASVHLSTPLLKGKDVSIPLPDIHMRGIGNESDGATLGEVFGIIFSRVNSGVLDAIADSGQVFGGGLKKIGDSLDSLKEQAEESGSEILEGVKGLFD